MANKRERHTRHITLKPDAMAIYDKWKEQGEAIQKTSQAIIEYENKNPLEQRIDEVDRRSKYTLNITDLLNQKIEALEQRIIELIKEYGGNK